MMGSSDYTTPQGHQTNLMVYGPGAYKFVDYQKLGIPLEVWLNILQLVCLNFRNTWWFTTLGAIAILIAAVCVDHFCVSRLSWRDCICHCSRRRKDDVQGSD